MSDTPDPVTKQELIDALAELKVGRSRSRGHRYVTSIMRRYGDGARYVHELDPKFYPAVFAAAGGDIISAVKFYGAVVDLPPTITIPTPEEFYGVSLDVPAKLPLNRKSPTRPVLRLRAPLRAEVEARLATAPRAFTPLVKDLTEKLAAAKAKTKRSSPGGRVDIGAPAQFGDEDAPRQYPSDGRKVS